MMSAILPWAILAALASIVALGFVGDAKGWWEL